MSAKTKTQIEEMRASLQKMEQEAGGSFRVSHWIFDGQNVLKVGFVDWVVWVETEMTEGGKAVVGRTDVAPGVDVRTDFLGAPPLTWDMDKHPLHFETMVFGGPMDGELDRYETVEQARAGHELMVARVRNALSR